MQSLSIILRLAAAENFIQGVWLLCTRMLLITKLFMPQDNKDLYAEEAAAQRERERQRMLSIPGLIAPNELQDEMVDS